MIVSNSLKDFIGDNGKSPLNKEEETLSLQLALHKKLSFSLRISSVNVKKSLIEYFIFCAVLFEKS